MVLISVLISNFFLYKFSGKNCLGICQSFEASEWFTIVALLCFTARMVREGSILKARTYMLLEVFWCYLPRTTTLSPKTVFYCHGTNILGIAFIDTSWFYWFCDFTATPHQYNTIQHLHITHLPYNIFTPVILPKIQYCLWNIMLSVGSSGVLYIMMLHTACQWRPVISLQLYLETWNIGTWRLLWVLWVRFVTYPYDLLVCICQNCLILCALI